MDHLVFSHRKEKGCERENLMKISMAHLVFSHENEIKVMSINNYLMWCLRGEKEL